jgi:hypothetical protein
LTKEKDFSHDTPVHGDDQLQAREEITSPPHYDVTPKLQPEKKISVEGKADKPGPSLEINSDRPDATPEVFNDPGGGLAHHNIHKNVEGSQEAGNLTQEEQCGFKLKKKVMPKKGGGMGSLVSARNQSGNNSKDPKPHTYVTEEPSIIESRQEVKKKMDCSDATPVYGDGHLQPHEAKTSIQTMTTPGLAHHHSRCCTAPPYLVVCVQYHDADKL